MRNAFVLALAVALAGCITPKSPYDNIENWLIREDPIRPFAVPADIFYVQGDLYTSTAKLAPINSYVQSEVGKGRFKGIARVFAPLIASEDDLQRAFQWYMRGHHYKKRRPLIFIGEGKGGALLQKFEIEHDGILKDRGLVASFYTDAARKGFVNADMVRKIKDAIARVRYKATWGREMPDGMLSPGPQENAPRPEK